MRITGDFKDWTVTQSLLAKILGVSVPRINQLIDEEIVMRDEQSINGAVLLIPSIRNYYMSKKSSSGGDDVAFWKEKGLHERAKRKTSELKLRKMEGELYEAETVEAVFFELLTTLKTHLLAMPAKFATILEGKTREEINEILTHEIENKLTELSGSYNADDFKEEINSESDEL